MASASARHLRGRKPVSRSHQLSRHHSTMPVADVPDLADAAVQQLEVRDVDARRATLQQRGEHHGAFVAHVLLPHADVAQRQVRAARDARAGAVLVKREGQGGLQTWAEKRMQHTWRARARRGGGYLQRHDERAHAARAQRRRRVALEDQLRLEHRSAISLSLSLNASHCCLTLTSSPSSSPPRSTSFTCGLTGTPMALHAERQPPCTPIGDPQRASHLQALA